MEEITLHRTDQKTLRFNGEMLGSSTTQEVQGPGQNRFHNFTVYLALKTPHSVYVIHDEYVSRWQNERGEAKAIICESAQDVTNYLVEHFGSEGLHLAQTIANNHAEFVETLFEDL